MSGSASPGSPTEPAPLRARRSSTHRQGVRPSVWPPPFGARDFGLPRITPAYHSAIARARKMPFWRIVSPSSLPPTPSAWGSTNPTCGSSCTPPLPSPSKPTTRRRGAVEEMAHSPVVWCCAPLVIWSDHASAWPNRASRRQTCNAWPICSFHRSAWRVTRCAARQGSRGRWASRNHRLPLRCDSWSKRDSWSRPLATPASYAFWSAMSGSRAIAPSPATTPHSFDDS